MRGGQVRPIRGEFVSPNRERAFFSSSAVIRVKSSNGRVRFAASSYFSGRGRWSAALSTCEIAFSRRQSRCQSTRTAAQDIDRVRVMVPLPASGVVCRPTDTTFLLLLRREVWRVSFNPFSCVFVSYSSHLNCGATFEVNANASSLDKTMWATRLFLF